MNFQFHSRRATGASEESDGSYNNETTRIEKMDLLILDDFGMQPLDTHNRSALIEIIEGRHGKRSSIITAQLPAAQWHDVIGEKTLLMRFWIVLSIMHIVLKWSANY